jgi:threonine synthase
VKAVAMPTNGNAGAAWSMYAARAGIGSLIVMPEDAPEITRRECVVSGAELYLVDGLINHAGALVKAAVEERTGYQEVSTLKEPYRIEGKKTMGYEIAEQLGWQVPDVILYPAGGGVGLIGIHKAMQEMQELGWIGRRCRAWSPSRPTAARRSWTRSRPGSTRARWWRAPTPWRSASTCPRRSATSWCSAPCASPGHRRRGHRRAILAELRNLAAAEGAWICPEGAACLAAAASFAERGWIDEHEQVVVLNTGAGLKYPETVVADVPCCHGTVRCPSRSPSVASHGGVGRVPGRGTGRPRIDLDHVDPPVWPGKPWAPSHAVPGASWTAHPFPGRSADTSARASPWASRGDRWVLEVLLGWLWSVRGAGFDSK